MDDDDLSRIDGVAAGITDAHIEGKLCETLASTDDAEFEALIEAGTLVTPEARELRARGKRMLYGDNDPDMTRIRAIREALAAGRITAEQARGYLTDAGCLPAGVKLHIRLAR